MNTPDNTPDGTPVGEPDSPPDSPPDSTSAGQPDGTSAGQPDGTPVGEPDGTPVGEPDDTPAGDPDGAPLSTRIDEPDSAPVAVSPGPPAAPPVPTPAAPPTRPVPTAPVASPASWGRVAEDGTVYVRTASGERAVGQMPDASPAEAMAFFTRRYEDLAFEVELLERRVKAGALGPDEAAASVKQVRGTLRGAQAVGDLAGLERRLDGLSGTIGVQREKRRAERGRKLEEATAAKERIAEEAERLGQGNDWRNGANRLRQLLDEWKVLPRLEKSVDDGLWRRFSTARTTYTRRRKAHFADLNVKRDSAREAKEKLVVEAEALSASTEWGPTAGRYRDLMRDWKAAGPAPKGVDDALWKRFRTAQDTFFGNRDAANAELDREFADNAVKKEALLAEAEALVPVTDLQAAKSAFRDLADRWDEAGKVPRERMKELEGRMRSVEQAIRGVEDDRWTRSNPEARARAADTVAQLEASIADLVAKREKALAAGETRRADEHASAIEARESWLAEARKALHEFS